MSLDFLKAPVDFQTAYFIAFGTAALYGFIMLLLIRREERRQRRSQRSHEER